MTKLSTTKSLAAVTAGATLLALTVAAPAHALDPENPFGAVAQPAWQTNGTVWTLASAKGKVFAGGSFTQVRPPGTAVGHASSLSRSNLVVLDAASGTPVTNCTVNVTLASSTATVRALVASPDGSVIYLGGSFGTVNGTPRSNIAAINADTCAVLPFNPGANSFVHAIAATATKVYFGGTFSTAGGQARTRLAAATPAGALLPWVPTAEDTILALAVDPTTGNVVLGGRMDLVNGQDSHDLAVVDGETGTTNVKNYPQPFFSYSPGQGQRQGNSAIKAITTDATGFYIGAEGTGGGVFDGRAAFDWGSYDQRWRDTCLGATQAVAVHKGVLFNANHIHDCLSEGLFEDGQRHYLNAQRTDNEKYVPWWPNTNGGTGESVGPRAITVAASGSTHYLWYGGEFTIVNGVAQQGLTRFAEGMDTGAPNTPQIPNLSSTTGGQVRVMIRATHDNDDRTLTYNVYRGANTTTPINPSPLTADSQFYTRPQLVFTDTGLTPGSTQTYRVRASDGTNLSAFSGTRSITVARTSNRYANQVVSDGADVYFRMEEASGTAAGNNGSRPLAGTYVNTPTLAGQPGALASYPGTSALFNGTNTFVRTDTREPAPSTYSLELWFKTSTTAGGRLIGYGNKALANGASGSPNSSSSQSDRVVYLGRDGRLLFGTLNSGVPTTVTSANTYNNNVWHHVVATQGSDGMRLYVDGQLVGLSPVTTAAPTNGYWRIGGDSMSSMWPNRPSNGYFAGNIDETAVYPTVLTSAQVANHYALSSETPPPSVPTASFDASPTSGTAPLTVRFTDTSTDSPTSWSWDFGNGTTSTVQNPSTTYTTGGTYTVTLRASNAAGTSTAATKTITVSNPDVPPATRTLTLNPTADTQVKQASPGTNYGSGATLWADTEDVAGNTSSAVHDYLEFEVPDLASGESISGARLSLNVTNPTGNGQAIYRTDAGWDEATVTWSSGRPGRSSATAVGNFGNMPVSRASVPVSGVTAGGDVSFELAPESTDGVLVSSSEDATEGNRPQLILTIASGGGSDTTAPPPPSVNPISGTYSSGQTVTMSDTESSAVIRYTTGDGTTVPTDPNSSSPIYSGPITLDSSRVIKARAFDAAGNASTVVRRDYTITSGGGTTRTVTLYPTADTQVKQASPGVNYGSGATLWADSEDIVGNASSAVHDYLKFDVDLAAGETITAARLSLNVTNSTGNGPAIYPTDTAWDEGAMTWSSGRPARSSTAVGNFGNMPVARVSTVVTGVTGAGDVSFELAPDSTDGVLVSSSEDATEGNRPQLILTISS